MIEPMMKPHAIRFSACKMKDIDVRLANSITIVMALDVAHATGKAYEIAKKVYPATKGWYQHNASAVPADQVSTIDDWEEVEE